ncbi:MAG TPA: hypothetical protein VIT20_02760 [Propionibacteriaceae bacterium]
MGIYAQRPGRLVGQVVGDLFVLGWAVVWGLAGLFVQQTIAVLAGPARETARTATRLSGDFTDAATQASKVPGVGDQLRRPFDAASETLGSVITAANNQVDSIQRLAVIMGWLVFLIPVAVVVAFWLPRRIRFYRQARAAQVFIDSNADLDLFALRAMSLQPMHVLAAVSDDPVTAWRTGDRAVINQLAELELRRSGLRMPESATLISGADPRIPDERP